MFLDLLVDVILLAVIIGGCVFGYRTGFFRLVSSYVRGVLCLILSLSLCKGVGDRLLLPMIYAPIRDLAYGYLREGRDGLASSIDRLLPAFSDLSVSPSDFSDPSGIEVMADGIAGLASTALSRAFAFILIFALSRLAFRFFISLVDGIAGIGPIGTVNRLLGATLCSVCAFSVALVIASAIDYAFGLDGLVNSRLVSEFEGGPIYRILRH